MRWSIATMGAIAIAVGLSAWWTTDAPYAAGERCAVVVRGTAASIRNDTWQANAALARLEKRLDGIVKRQRRLLAHAEVTRLEWAATVTKAEAKP